VCVSTTVSDDIGMSVWTFLFLTVLGLVILRFRDPDLERPYRIPFLVPILFLVVSGVTVIVSFWFNPLMALFFVVLGLFGAALRSKV
jgi:L-type amino acid transporter 9